MGHPQWSSHELINSDTNQNDEKKSSSIRVIIGLVLTDLLTISA